MVFQHGGHVRRVPASHARRPIQSVLFARSQLLGATGHRAMLAAREAAERFQRASRTSYCDARLDRAKLSLPFYLHGLGGLHHT